MNLVETLKAHWEAWKQFPQWNWETMLKAGNQAIDSYRMLSQEQAHELANYGLVLFDASRGKDDDRNHLWQMLGDLAIFVPGSLRGIYPRLIEYEVFWPYQMYLNADAETRDHLIGLVEQGRHSHMLGDVLACLAWIGDETVQGRFSGWRGKLSLPFNGEIEWYTREAGWELDSTGKRRDLYHQQWRQLVPIEQSGVPDTQTPASAGTLHDEPCQWCGLPMAYIIDLNLRAPQLAFLGLPGERLRIPFCEWCTLAAPLYSDVDFNGAAHWNTANERRPDLGDPGEHYNPYWKEVRYALGSLSANPFESLASCMLVNTYLGGLPKWIQYPEYPLCPGCRQTMRCLGQFNPGDVMPGGDEGYNYAFTCVSCGKAAVCHQQT